MPAHGGDLHYLLIGQLVDLAPDAEREVDGVALDAGLFGAAVHVVHQAGDDHGVAVVGLLEGLHDGDEGVAVAENGVYHRCVGGDVLAQLLNGVQRQVADADAAHVHGVEGGQQVDVFFERLDAVLVVDATGGHDEHDVVVGAAVLALYAVQSVGHFDASFILSS